MQKLLLADRVKGRKDSFLAPLLPALEQHYDTRFICTGPGKELAAAIDWADIVWLEWCWDHAVWATREALPTGKPCILRLHSVEALQTNYPGQVDWSRVSRLVTVANDITETLLRQFPSIADAVPIQIIANGIDMARFRVGSPDRFRVAWVGHLEPKKNPMLLMQIAHRTHQLDPRFSFHVAGAITDLRTGRYLNQAQQTLGLDGVVHFEGHVADMPAWYTDKGTLLSTSMYESFGMNVGEAMAVGAFPIVHHFPGADQLWPTECLFTSVDDAVALIKAARPGLYRDWVQERYSLTQQVANILALLQGVLAEAPRRATGLHFPGSAAYWDQRYLRGGNSGAGSTGRLAAFKAATVNRLVADNAIGSVLELGCGDGRQLALANYPSYVGVDVSPACVALCRERFVTDMTKRFLVAGTEDPEMADLVLSLDVIFHLVEDDVFQTYMTSLFARARRLITIYASDCDQTTGDAHVRHRSVSAWVARHAPEWERVAHIANPYPYDAARPGDTSHADFHIFARRTAAGEPTTQLLAEVSPGVVQVKRGRLSFRVADHPSSRDGADAFLGDAEAATLGFFDAVLPHCTRMIDIGAYVGMMTLYSALHVREVHAVEASPTHQGLLRANIALNPELADLITVHPSAIGPIDGTATLFRKGYANSGSSIFCSVERTGVVQGQREAEVPVRAAASLLEELGINAATLVKIDIEGAEYAVLPAIAALLAERRPFLQVSFHPFNIVRDDPYLTELARLRATLEAAQALASYRYIYLHGCMATGREGWWQINVGDREVFLRDYLLARKQVPRVASPQLGFVDAVGFSQVALPTLGG